MSDHTRMQTRMDVDRPAEVMFTLRITMSLADWVKLREQLDSPSHSTSFPAYHLQEQIREMAKKAHTSFVTDADAE